METQDMQPKDNTPIGQWCMHCNSDMIASAIRCSICFGPLLRKADPEYKRLNPDD